MLTDYFLKFSSKEEAIQIFSTIPGHTYSPYDPETNQPINELKVTSQSETFAIDEVGILFENDAVYDEDFNLISPPTQIQGYHYNYRILYGNSPEIPLPVELESYLVTPEIPQRTFF